METQQHLSEVHPNYRYRFILEYDGSAFVGWQWQKDLPSVQEALQNACFRLTQERPTFHGAGRTDRGVHALGQVAHADFSRFWSLDSLRRGLNFYLHALPLRVLSVASVPDTFDARFSALAREYSYVILNRPSESAFRALRSWWIPQPLDVSAMQETALLLQGTHDFSKFRHKDCQALSPIKTLTQLSIATDQDLILIVAKAPSFLHRQVRRIVGALVQVAKHKWTAKDIKRLLEDPHGPDSVPTAPSHGLYLKYVTYPCQEQERRDSNPQPLVLETSTLAS
jgi:tRNA pseudouridine38-40 synthase